MPNLSVNIDHVATLRQTRRGLIPDPVAAARICELAGANGIVAHLREDRRHINEHDVRRLRKMITTKLNLEMSVNPGIIRFACRIKPDQVTLVPEKRQELTTEGGLNVAKNFKRIHAAVGQLQKKGIQVSLFVDPVENQIDQAQKIGAEIIELHTGVFSDAKSAAIRRRELHQLKKMTQYAISIGLTVCAGHGLNYKNTPAVARIKGMTELNTGHSIVCRSVFVGLDQAVREMLKLCQGQTRKKEKRDRKK